MSHSINFANESAILLKNWPAGRPRLPFRNERSGNETWIEETCWKNLLNIEQHRGPTYNWTDGLDGIGYLGVGWDSPDELYRGANNQNSVLIQYYWTRLEEKEWKSEEWSELDLGIWHLDWVGPWKRKSGRKRGTERVVNRRVGRVGKPPGGKVSLWRDM